MQKTRVLILCKGAIVDSFEFDDPRTRFIDEFNSLNRDTPFVAVRAEASGLDTGGCEVSGLYPSYESRLSSELRRCQSPVHRCRSLREH